MGTDAELFTLARIRAHDVLIQNLIRLVFNNDPDAIRDFAARQLARLDTSHFSDLSPEMSARLSYAVQEAVAQILDGAILLTESRQLEQPSPEPDA